ncbi:MAG: rod shape-determining protein MreC [Candidatus Parcubacteria bacterium]|nr:rod shape-determining protein MreC [Candidatus Parcubacteria bacterium]
MFFNKRNNKILVIILVIFIALVFIFFHRPIRSVFNSMSNSLELWFWDKGQKDSGFWLGFFNASNLVKENQNLRNENQALLKNLTELNKFKEENERLRTVLDLGLIKDFNLRETSILSKDVSGDYIIINKGEKDGIRNKMPVITFEKVLVGEVTEVFNNSSRVRLITDSGVKFGVKIADTDIQALAKGESNGNLSLDLIPKDLEVPIGALVSTSGPLEGGYPSNLLIGTISEINNADQEPFQKAKVDVFFKTQEETLLFVITD